MCGRFTLRARLNTILQQFAAEYEGELSPRYNVAPTQQVAAVRQRANGGRQLVELKWGLIPSWAKDQKIGSRMINARAETVAEKPAFRAAFQRRRCLIIADGFYEWKKLEDQSKQPYFIHRIDDKPFAFAGLWERWEKGENPVESCTIITTEANPFMQPLHHRMPVVLPADVQERWLDPEFDDKTQLSQIIYQHDGLESEFTSVAVSTEVNNPRNDSPDCLQTA